MAVAQYSVVAHDWINLEFIINDLTKRVVGQEVHPTSSPTFADITLTGDLDLTGNLAVDGTVTLNDLTASRLVATDAGKALESIDLANWVTGTTKRVTVADDGDGTITLSAPQDLDTGSAPTFSGLLPASPSAQDLGSWTGGGANAGEAIGLTLAFTYSGGAVDYRWRHLYLSGNLSDGTNALTVSNAKDAYDHITANGSSHSYINQDVTTTGTPTLAGLTVTNACVLGSNSVVFQPNADSTSFFQIKDSDGGTTVFHIDTTNELIGIGTSQPEAVRLVTLVKTDGADALFIKAADSANSSTLGFGVNTAIGYSYIQSHKVGAGTSQPLRLYQALSCVVEIDASQNTKIGDGGTTNYVQIDSDGDSRFIGGAGLPFGSCYGNEIGWTQASAVQNTWYEISDADMSDGQLHDVAHDGSGKLTVTYAGMYLCTYTMSGETDAGAGTHIQTTFSVSGTETGDGMNHSETIGANSQIAISGTAILDLPASATLEVSVRTTDAGTPDISVDHLNITCVQIGGT